MLFGMLGSKHLFIADISNVAVWICFGIIALLEVNALVGKMGPMASVKGVIHSSLGLTVLIWVVLAMV